MVAYQNDHMRDLAHKYGQVLFIDGTYKVNRNDYALYFFSVKDGNGSCQVVYAAFTANEQQQSLGIIFESFSDMNDLYHIETIMIDKDLKEVNKIEVSIDHK